MSNHCVNILISQSGKHKWNKTPAAPPLICGTVVTWGVSSRTNLCVQVRAPTSHAQVCSVENCLVKKWWFNFLCQYGGAPSLRQPPAAWFIYRVVRSVSQRPLPSRCRAFRPWRSELQVAETKEDASGHQSWLPGKPIGVTCLADCPRHNGKQQRWQYC